MYLNQDFLCSHTEHDVCVLYLKKESSYLDKVQITETACINASGDKMPPMVIVDQKYPKVSRDKVPETIIALTNNG